MPNDFDVAVNVELLRKLASWTNEDGSKKSYYQYFLRVSNGSKEVEVKITDSTGKLRIIDDLGHIIYDKK